ncbi:hypothetical protein LTR86_010041 [Recurvomyces mirabilis]|nr:hypothetical protein LTR86_010041 [Recurvomyces mirabilis]
MIMLSDHDYIVVGSGFTALAFIDEMMSVQPKANVLCIEAGNDDYQTHYKGLLRATTTNDKVTVAQPDVAPGNFPWQLSHATRCSTSLNACAGACHLLGGRSNYWYGWCLRPEPEQMRDFPDSMVEASKQPIFWHRAQSLLNVYSIQAVVSEASQELQAGLDSALDNVQSAVPSILNCTPALFAKGFTARGVLSRYRVIDRLRRLTSPAKAGSMELLLQRKVLKLRCGSGDNHARLIETDQGDIHLTNADTKVILCAGTIPNTTILFRSFPVLGQTLGRRVTGHFRSHIFARIPRTAFGEDLRIPESSCSWGSAATVLIGLDLESGRQYHIQLSIFHCPNYSGNYHEIVSELPRYGTVPVEGHLEGLGDGILISCATLGEFGPNKASWLRSVPDAAYDEPSVELQLSLDETDKKLWDLMDTATCDAIENIARVPSNVEYWHEAAASWTSARPIETDVRSPVLVHEASCTPVGEVLDEQFRVIGCENVFVTGSGILPTAGSWNPTLTIVAFAQELARISAAGRGDAEPTEPLSHTGDQG